MPHVQIRNVPGDVHAELVRRSERAGQSLQQYLATQLAVIAATPTVDDLWDRIGIRATGRLTSEEAIAALEAERARR